MGSFHYIIVITTVPFSFHINNFLVTFIIYSTLVHDTVRKGMNLGSLCILLLYTPHVCSVSLEIDNQSGNDSISCLTEHGPPCYSLDFIARNHSVLANPNLTITIISPKLLLQSLVSFSNVSNFTLQGMNSNNTVIACQFKCGQYSSVGAGLSFINSNGIELNSFTLNSCGIETRTSFSENDSHGLLILKSRNIKIHNVIVSQSKGYGLSLINTRGNVSVQDCTFKNNWYDLKCFSTTGSGGLLIAVKSCSTCTARYEINNCIFHNNSANIKNKNLWKDHATHGGGMAVFLLNGANSIFMVIQDCDFTTNKAQLGAGLYLICYSGCNYNEIYVLRSNFQNNTAITGGGGMDVGFSMNISHPKSIPMNNSILFHSCNVTKNVGQFGGGVAIFSSSAYKFLQTKHTKNIIKFQSCKFSENTANGGAAVDINRATSRSNQKNLFISLNFFINCSFIKNTAGKNSITGVNITQTGAFFTSRVYAYFEGKTIFAENAGTALYISETIVNFENATTIFTQNTGEKGGAILLVGEAYLNLKGKNQFKFEKNTGAYGGAICAIMLETHYFMFTDNCFIKCYECCNSSLEFIDNIATTGIANDIFVSNLHPCASAFSCHNLTSFFDSQCFGNFTFSNSVQNYSHYATATSTILIKEKSVSPIPGIPLVLKISQKDQFGKEVGKLFPLSAGLKQNNSSVAIDKDYSIVHNNKITLRGKPGDNATLILQTNFIAVIRASTTIKMDKCPPGFIFQNQSLICKCSVNKFITQCMNNNVALKQGNWAGYLDNDIGNSADFGVGNCDYRLCKFNRSLSSFGSYLLPSKPEDLEQLVCGGTHRRGILCGLCDYGYTVYYHSPDYACHKEKSLCSLGIIFYVLSELVPVTVLFLVIILFNIHLTSGSLYSFIFYAQSIDALYVNAYGAIEFKGISRALVEIFRIFYGIFNLKFFQVHQLSFCLHQNMTAMDSFLIQYLAVLYALLLIFITILVLKLNSLYTCIKLCYKCGRRNIRGSVINGLTAFVALCYFKCVELTFSILIPVQIHVNGTINRNVVLFNGELNYLKRDHLKYAIPAIISFFVIILPPPVLLLSESLLMMLNRHFKIKRNFVTYFLHRIRLKALPFLDSFQGCFKDNCRCFAGLFFVYKAVLLLPYVHTGVISNDYESVEVILFFILIVQLIYCPFQYHWHNKLDALLLVNLILVNMLTVHHYNTALLGNSDKSLMIWYESVQIFCLGLPAVYFSIYLSYKLFTKLNLKFDIKEKLKLGLTRQQSCNELVQSESLPFRLTEEENLSNSYFTFYTSDELTPHNTSINK